MQEAVTMQESPKVSRAKEIAERKRQISRITNSIIHYPPVLPDVPPEAVANDWRAGAECRPESGIIAEVDIFNEGENLEEYISQNEKNQLLEAAKATCGRCAVQIYCLEFALENSVSGFCGGMTEDERDSMKRRRPN